MTAAVKQLGQYMTPDWAAAELVARYFPQLSLCDRVVEPSCGRGAFLRAVPDYVPMVGIEIDPELAARARASSGRAVIVGDFRTTQIPLAPTLVLGNPPFQHGLVMEFLERAFTLLPDEGKVGFILPAFVFQTASTVHRLSERWHMQQDMLPRNLFTGLSHPLCFAVLTKGARRGLVGFALYHEAHAVNRLQARYRALLGEATRSVWAAVTLAALEALGGEADLPDLYREIAGARPTPNRFWREKVRQQLQLVAVRVAAGRWRLPMARAA